MAAYTSGVKQVLNIVMNQGNTLAYFLVPLPSLLSMIYNNLRHHSSRVVRHEHSRCVLCSVYCVWYRMLCAMCIISGILCSVYCVWYCMLCAICIIFGILCSVHCVWYCMLCAMCFFPVLLLPLKYLCIYYVLVTLHTPW